MKQENADLFLRRVLADPDNAEPRLAFADWLQRQGDQTRSSLIREQERLRRLRYGSLTVNIVRHRDSLCAEAFPLLRTLFGSDSPPTIYELTQLQPAGEVQPEVLPYWSFAHDCAERVLAIYETECPGDHSLRRALAQTRPAWHDPNCPNQVIEEIRSQVGLLRDALTMDPDERTVETVAEAAAATAAAAVYEAMNTASSAKAAHSASTLAQTASGLVVECQARAARTNVRQTDMDIAVLSDKARDQELFWQTGRLIDLLLYGWTYPLPQADQEFWSDRIKRDHY